MARSSSRKKALRKLRAINARRKMKAMLRWLFDDEDPFEEDVDGFFAAELSRVASRRYFKRQTTYRRREDRWKKLLYDTNYLSESEFLAHFRVTRASFWKLHEFVRDDPGYQPTTHRTFRGGAELHLLALLKFLGMSGNGNSAPNLALFFGLGKGSIGNYLRRAINAILRLKDSVVTWPDEEERRIISQRIKDEFDFPNCVGIVDGTLFPLASKPQNKGESYYTRKGGYAINAMTTCDDRARVRDLIVGWAGSVHDNRVWSNGRLHLHQEEFFRACEYLLADSAFQASKVMVPAFKKPPKAELDRDHAHFNTKLAKIRIRSEHCIGMIKARFQYLKSIRARLKTVDDMRNIIRYVECAVILHNLLIFEPIPTEWEEEIERAQLDKNDELNTAIPENTKGDERRRQLLAYLLELRG